jgi:hypothetical protein
MKKISSRVVENDDEDDNDDRSFDITIKPEYKASNLDTAYTPNVQTSHHQP